MMDNNIKSYLRSSKIDYLSHFGQAWIGFNSWYDQRADDKSEWLRIKNASNASPMRDYFLQSLKFLNIVDPFIADEVEKLSVCECDGSTYKLDTSGFRFRLGCTNKNIFTEFLKNSPRLKVLKNRSYGLSFFKETNQEDKLFKQLYKQYSSHMATPEKIVHEYDASTITEELLSIDIDHYGEMLHHNLKKEIGKSIYTLDYVFGKIYFDLCERLNEITSIPTARKEGLEEQYRCKGFDIFERYMYLLYSLRCAYFHGDLDPKNEIAQISAQYALLGLRELINTIEQE